MAFELVSCKTRVVNTILVLTSSMYYTSNQSSFGISLKCAKLNIKFYPPVPIVSDIFLNVLYSKVKKIIREC